MTVRQFPTSLQSHIANCWLRLAGYRMQDEGAYSFMHVIKQQLHVLLPVRGGSFDVSFCSPLGRRVFNQTHDHFKHECKY